MGKDRTENEIDILAMDRLSIMIHTRIYNSTIGRSRAVEPEGEFMNHGLSDQVRTVALDKFVKPAVRAGKVRFSVAVRDLMRHLQADGFPERNWPQVCTAIQAGKFLRENGLEIEGVDGPPKKQSPTVVVRYRVAGRGKTEVAGAEDFPPEGVQANVESPEAWAFRLTERLRGLMKEEISARGGAEGYMRWVRGYDEEEG
jgi:hypothetical protein